jgi:putative Holliday junction resolvase
MLLEQLPRRPAKPQAAEEISDTIHPRTFMRTLAVDFGLRRVGLAMSDEGGEFATPLDVLEITSPQQATDRILKLCIKEQVRQLVVGLPLNMDGSFGPAARQTINWGRALSERIGKPVLFVDERLSSFQAEQEITDRRRGGERITRKQKKSRLDAHAAAGFLQAFLDGKLEPIDAPENA